VHFVLPRTNFNAVGHRKIKRRNRLKTSSLERCNAMKKENKPGKSERAAGFMSGKALLLGVAGSLAAVAWLTKARDPGKAKRYADRGEERRNPMHFFLAGRYPRRRKIDLSGERPLFERRQSVYDSY
jgi:hypothetical protein